MNKVKQSWPKGSLGTVLSIVFMVLGIGCISWAMLSMGDRSDYFADATRGRDSIPTTFAPELNTGDSTAPVESEPFLVLSALTKTLYPKYPVEGDNIGSLTIPALNRKLPILQGTGLNVLKKGVVHFTKSVLPGEKDNCVLSGHRETVFRKLGNLKIGDLLIVKTSAGIFTYKVKRTRIVHKDDKTVIVPTDHAVLTLTTCYPFYTPGYHPDRYIVQAT
ncbi:MAG: class D sortase, partial [Ignavibacteriales bacterium]